MLLFMLDLEEFLSRTHLCRKPTLAEFTMCLLHVEGCQVGELYHLVAAVTCPHCNTMGHPNWPGQYLKVQNVNIYNAL